MKMIVLPIKKQWFLMVRRGEKKEEYRALSTYYDRLFLKHEGKRIWICLRNGYRRDSPRIYCEATPVRGKTGKAEWGAQPGVKYWVLKIEKVTETDQAEQWGSERNK